MFDDNALQAGRRRRRPPPLTSVEQELDRGLAAWRAFTGARRLLDRRLRTHGVSFAQWRVLDLTERMVRAYQDVVGQMEIAEELDLDAGGISNLLDRLSRAGLVNIEPECWRMLNGVLLAPRGEAALRETREMVRAELLLLLEAVRQM